MRERTTRNPWNLFGLLFPVALIGGMALPLLVLQGLGVPDSLAWLIVPCWLLTVPGAIWGAVRLTERILGSGGVPVFNWPAVRRDAAGLTMALFELTGGLLVLAVYVLIIVAVVSLLASFPLPLAIIVGAIIIAWGLPR